MSGIYCVARRAMLETGLNDKQVTAALEELKNAGMVVYHEQLLLVASRVKNLHSRGNNIAKSIVKEIAALPADHVLVKEWLKVNSSVVWLSPFLQDFLTPLEESYQESREGLNKSLGTPLEGLLTSDIRHLTTDNTEKEEGCGEKKKQTKRIDHDQPVPDMPDELADTLGEVMVVLQTIHDVKGGTAPTIGAASKVLADNPRRAHLQIAKDLEHWLLYGNGRHLKRGDVVSRYRNFVGRAEDLPIKQTPAAGGRVHHVDQRLAELEALKQRDAQTVEATAVEVTA